MLLSEIRSFVKVLLHKPDTSASDDTGTPKNATINAHINDARNELYTEFSAQFPARFGSNTTLSYTANADYTALPVAVQRRPILNVVSYSTGITQDPQPIMGRHISEIGNYQTSGYPAIYAVMGVNIYLRPIPSSALTLSLNYVAALTELSGDSDTPSEFPGEFHRLIGYLAALRLRQFRGEPVDGLDVMVSDWKQRMQEYMKYQVQDDGVRNTAMAGVYDVAY